MSGKSLEEEPPFNEGHPVIEQIHDQYRLPSNARTRRAYMDLARGNFYGTVFREANIDSQSRVLDLGCGDGTDLINLNELGHIGRKVGLEIPARDRQATSDKLSYIIDNLITHKVGNTEVILGDAQKIPLEDNAIDAVIAASSLQEVPDIELALDEIHRVLVDGGLLIIIENRIDNKPLHHGYLQMMGQIIGGAAPDPFSARFTYEKALSTIENRPDFKVIGRIKQNKKNDFNLSIGPQELISLLLSLDTYRYAFKSRLEPWADEQQAKQEQQAFERRLKHDWPAARRAVQLDVMKKIRLQGAALEKIKRGAVISEAIKSSGRQTVFGDAKLLSIRSLSKYIQ